MTYKYQKSQHLTLLFRFPHGTSSTRVAGMAVSHFVFILWIPAGLAVALGPQGER
jgi:hypothetical protein